MIKNNRIPKIVKEIEKAQLRANIKATALVETDAKNKVPVDTGNLKNSIHSIPKDGLVGTNVEYAGKIEFEHTPYLRPALEKNRGKIKDIVAEEVRRATK